MRHIIIAVMLFLAATSVYAEDGSPKKRDYTLRTEGTESVSGEVSVFDAADLKRPNSRLVIIDQSGKPVEFEVRPSAPIYRSDDGAILTSYDLYPGLMVKVDYVKSEGGALKAVGVKALSKEKIAAPAESGFGGAEPMQIPLRVEEDTQVMGDQETK